MPPVSPCLALWPWRWEPRLLSPLRSVTFGCRKRRQAALRRLPESSHRTSATAQLGPRIVHCNRNAGFAQKSRCSERDCFVQFEAAGGETPGKRGPSQLPNARSPPSRPNLPRVAGRARAEAAGLPDGHGAWCAGLLALEAGGVRGHRPGRMGDAEPATAGRPRGWRACSAPPGKPRRR